MSPRQLWAGEEEDRLLDGAEFCTVTGRLMDGRAGAVVASPDTPLQRASSGLSAKHGLHFEVSAPVHQLTLVEILEPLAVPGSDLGRGTLDPLLGPSEQLLH